MVFHQESMCKSKKSKMCLRRRWEYTVHLSWEVDQGKETTLQVEQMQWGRQLKHILITGWWCNPVTPAQYSIGRRKARRSRTPGLKSTTMTGTKERIRSSKSVTQYIYCIQSLHSTLGRTFRNWKQETRKTCIQKKAGQGQMRRLTLVTQNLWGCGRRTTLRSTGLS